MTDVTNASPHFSFEAVANNPTMAASTPLLARFPVLPIDDVYHLREHHPDDAPAFYDYYTHPDVSRYIFAEKPVNVVEAQQELAYCYQLFYRGDAIFWTVANHQTGAMVGSVGLYIKSNHPEPELCFELAPANWRQGIMTRALRRVLTFARSTLKLTHVDAIIYPENEASVALLKRLGFVFHQTLENHKFYQDKWYTVDCYRLLLTS